MFPFRLLKMFWYKLTGKTDRYIDIMAQDPDVASAMFDAAKGKKTKNTKQLREAVAALVVQASKKKTRITQIQNDVATLQTEANGYLVMAKRASEGLTKEQAEANGDYQSHRAAYASKMASIKDKTNILNGPDGKGGLVKDLATLERDINGYKAQLLEMARKIGKIDEEKQETIAAITAAKEREGIDDIVSGISNADSGEKELEQLRSVRERAVARSEIASHMAGTNVSSADALAREIGAAAAGNEDFDALMNFKEPATATPAEPVKLPEA